MSEVTKEWFKEGYEKGIAVESVNTEREKARADAAEKRAVTAEAELEQYKKIYGELNKAVQ